MESDASVGNGALVPRGTAVHATRASKNGLAEGETTVIFHHIPKTAGSTLESVLERPAEPQPRQVEIEPAVSGRAAPETVSTPEPASEESDLESSWLDEEESDDKGREEEDEGPLRLDLEPEDEEEPDSEAPPERDEKD